MKIKIIEMLHRARGACCAISAGLFLLGGAHSAWAGWTASNTSHAWSGYNVFKYVDNGYEWHFANQIGGNTPSGFWEQAEEIEVAEDAYEWAGVYDNAHLSSYETEVEGLCDGFVELHGDDWSSDSYNDDMAWACVAFIRAYDITGTTRWKNDAVNNYNTIWGRAYNPANNGLFWRTPSNLGIQYQNSAANWTFVIAGNLIYDAIHDQNELNRANTVYGFCKQYLYNSSNGAVYDGIYPPPNASTITTEISYNYGVCIGAAVYEVDSTTIGKAAASLAYSESGGGTLQDYGVNNNNSGFNGIALRWLGFAYYSGYDAVMGPGVVSWAQANVTKAWSMRNGEELIWQDWNSPTPDNSTGKLYSWDCSSAMAGMFDIPMP